MVRQKKTSRKSTHGLKIKQRRALRIYYPNRSDFKDHAGRRYNLVAKSYNENTHRTIIKLSIQLYCLGTPKFSAHDIGKSLLCSKAVENWSNYKPRVDVYTGFSDVEACIEHHRREKAFRRQAVKTFRQEAVAGLSEEAAAEKLVTEIKGREPLPHIIPTWCASSKSDWWRSMDRYRSWILVIPETRSSWEDVIDNGLLQVKFDLDATPEMFTEDEDDYEESSLSKDGWVYVDWTGIEKAKPVEISLLCLREERRKPRDFGYSPEIIEPTPGSRGRFCDVWANATLNLWWDCAYVIESCDDCDEDVPHEWCEADRNEHYYDEDGQCIACRREREYRRRSKRIASQGPKTYTF
ncbi:hypothetical protein F66182_5499 [Fusarium sp. NRRL 66182]|nr:hypothetical protein F66182_5499 [Fusarium sp. NRRL 66182]